MSALRHQKSFCMGDEAKLSQEVVIEEGNEAAVGGGIEDSVSLDAQTFPATDGLHGDLEAGAEARIDILVKGRAHADAIRSADLPFQMEQCFGKDASPAGRGDANGNLY